MDWQEECIDLFHVTKGSFSDNQVVVEPELTSSVCTIKTSNNHAKMLEYQIGWRHDGAIEYKKPVVCFPGKQEVDSIPASRRIYFRWKFF